MNYFDEKGHKKPLEMEIEKLEDTATWVIIVPEYLVHLKGPFAKEAFNLKRPVGS